MNGISLNKQIWKIFQYFQYKSGLRLPRSEIVLTFYYFSDFELDLLREELDHSFPPPAGHDVDISEGEEDELRRQR